MHRNNVAIVLYDALHDGTKVHAAAAPFYHVIDAVGFGMAVIQKVVMLLSVGQVGA